MRGACAISCDPARRQAIWLTRSLAGEPLALIQVMGASAISWRAGVLMRYRIAIDG
jgi:hypothetical protein